MRKKYNIKLDKILTKEFLIKEYINNKKSLNQIAIKVGGSCNLIRNRLIKFKIKIRTVLESSKYIFKEKYKISKKELYNLYWNNNKSMLEISKIINCGHETIRRRLTKYNIKIKSNRESHIGKYIGKNCPNFKDGRCSKPNFCIDCGKKLSRHDAERCRSCATKITNKKRWQDKNFREKMLNIFIKSRQIKPNKPEKLLKKLFNKILPKEYKFVGDGKVFLGNFCPDFININGQKKIIEHYGDYWHNKPDAKIRNKRRIKTYKKYGYKTLIIWEHELKDLNKVKEKVLEFNK